MFHAVFCVQAIDFKCFLNVSVCTHTIVFLYPVLCRITSAGYVYRCPFGFGFRGPQPCRVATDSGNISTLREIGLR